MKWAIVAISVLLIAIAGYTQLYSPDTVRVKIIRLAFSEFIKAVEDGVINDVQIEELTLTGTYKNGTRFTTLVPFQDYHLIERLLKYDVKINVKKYEASMFQLSEMGLHFIFMIFVILSIFSQMRMGGGGGGIFNELKDAMTTKKHTKSNTVFADVAGLKEAKEELQEIVAFLKDPEKIKALGGRMPRGVLLCGPPGTGKTLLARAIAGEANCHFMAVTGSEFVQIFVGVGAMRIRKLFEEAKRKSPCVIFIDEVDSIGGKRNARHGNKEHDQTLLQLLSEMDGFEPNTNIIVIAATNMPQDLDPALLRSGRFDRKVNVDLPRMQERFEILCVHARSLKMADNIDLMAIAGATARLSGADLANIMNEAAIIAASENKTEIDMDCVRRGMDKVVMGRERRSLVMTDKEKKNTAYHEAGHAILMFVHGIRIQQATILPRGWALGFVRPLDEDKVSVSHKELINQIQIAMAGRVAEVLILGNEEYTGGASNDIEVATKIARYMVHMLGMGAGVMNYTPRVAIDELRIYSEQTSYELDKTVRKILEDAYDATTKILNHKIDDLHKLAAALLEKETIQGEEVETLLGGGKQSQNESIEENVPPAIEG
jgi:cell division protease FtsH